jgi:autotransporter-associated beta strand protein
VPLLSVTQADGLATNGGSHTLSLASSGARGVGRFTLVDYSGSPISSGFTLAPLPQRLSGSLVYDTAATTIDLDITGVDTLRWKGSGSTTWDTGSAVNVGGSFNWVLASSGTTATNFFTGDQVGFDDSAANGTVAIVGTVSPGVIAASNAALDYTLGGAGSTYAAGIQFGSASTAATGTLNLNAGTLFVGAAGMFDGSTGANTIAVNLGGGTLAAQAAWSSALALTLTSATTSTLNTAGGDISLSGVIGGAGNLRKLGTGTLSLSSSSSTFTGGVTVDGGTLAVSKLSDAGVNSSLGAGTGGITFNGGNLSYIGTGDSTNRTVDLLAGGTVSANGSGAVQFTAASLTHSGTASARTLNLGGSSTAGNTSGWPSVIAAQVPPSPPWPSPVPGPGSSQEPAAIPAPPPSTPAPSWSPAPSTRPLVSPSLIPPISALFRRSRL